MLYISRYIQDNHIGEDCYGVVDTDDGKEEVLTWEELEHDIIRYKLDIKGCKVNKGFAGKGFLEDIIPWQDPQYLTRKQVKLKALAGIDVRVWKDEISYIQLNSEVMQPRYRLRLSEFGKYINGRGTIQPMDSIMRSSCRLVAVLDDSIDFVGKFPRARHWICWDISDVTSMEVVEAFGEEMIRSGISVDRWDLYVTDRNNRLNCWR